MRDKTVVIGDMTIEKEDSLNVVLDKLYQIEKVDKGTSIAGCLFLINKTPCVLAMVGRTEDKTYTINSVELTQWAFITLTNFNRYWDATNLEGQFDAMRKCIEFKNYNIKFIGQIPRDHDARKELERFILNLTDDREYNEPITMDFEE